MIDAVNGSIVSIVRTFIAAVHELSERATRAYEACANYCEAFHQCRERTRNHFCPRSDRGDQPRRGSSTDDRILKAGDEILISALEHHSNIVPWQLLCDRSARALSSRPINDDGELILEEFERRSWAADGARRGGPCFERARNGACRFEKSSDMAHASNVPVLIDGAQAVAHFAVDVQELGCDFYAFSGHKVFGPTGIGVLYGLERFAGPHAALSRRRRHDPFGDF